MSALDDAASMDPWAHRQLQRMKEELTRLRAEVEVLRPDAERYRMIRAANVIQLRKKKCQRLRHFYVKVERWLYETPEELDAVIDALRGEGE